MTRALDMILSGLAIVLLLPFMIPIMIGLKLTGEHDIFYTQDRIGKGGKPFKLMKFATMLKDSPNLPGGMYTSENDPRILPMGKFLRKTKINELPQLINIFRGEMSIIGYRPTVYEHYKAFGEENRQKLASSLPGLSGIGSIVFRNEEEMLQRVEEKGGDKDRFHQEVIQPYKGKLEAWYVEHKSLFMYIRLILLTVDAVLHPDGHRWWSELKKYGLPKPPKGLKGYL